MINATLVKGTETATFTAREHGGVSLTVTACNGRGSFGAGSLAVLTIEAARATLANLKRKGWHENS